MESLCASVLGLLERVMENLGYILIAVFFAFISMFYNKEARTMIGFLISFTTAIAVGVLSGNVADHYFGVNNSAAVVAVSALIANDLVRFILGLAGFINKRQANIFEAVLCWLQKRVK